MSKFDWEFVGSLLIDREHRPVLVLDLNGRIIRANRALLFFLQDATRTHLVDFCEEWVSPPSREAFQQAWAGALRGERQRVAVSLTPLSFHFEPVFEVLPLLSEGTTQSVMLVMVDAVASGAALPLVPPTGVLYEVSISVSGEPDRLVRSFSSRPLHRVDPAAPCYRSLRGQAQPCAVCPVRGLDGEAPRAVVRLQSSAPFHAELLTAQRRAEGHATVQSIPIDEKTYSSMVHSRVEALGQKSKLTPRERQVLSLLLMGRTLDDVAAVEGITARTAKYHQQNLLRKLGAESRTDLFRLLT